MSARSGGAGRGIALTVLANLGSLVIGLATSAILARTLGPAGRGAYAAILAWPAVIAVLGILGLNQSAVYWSARRPDDARPIVSTSALLAVAILVPVLAATWVVMPALLRAQAPETVAAARRFAVLFGFANAAWLATIGTLQGLRLFAAWNRVRVLQGLIWLALLGTASVLVPGDPGRDSLLFATSFLLAIPLALVALARASARGWAPSASLVRPLLRYGLLGWSATVPIYLNRRLDQLAMAALVEPRVIGYYAVAGNMSLLVSSVISSIANVALPQVAATEDPTARLASARRYVRFSVIAGVACGAVMVLATPILIPLVFGRGFAPSVLPALLLIPVAVFQGVATVTEDILMGLDRARSVALAEGIGVAVTAGGLAFALPRFPLLGAPVTLLCSCALVMLLAARACARQLGGSARDFLVPGRADWREALGAGRRLLRRSP